MSMDGSEWERDLQAVLEPPIRHNIASSQSVEVVGSPNASAPAAEQSLPQPVGQAEARGPVPASQQSQGSRGVDPLWANRQTFRKRHLGNFAQKTAQKTPQSFQKADPKIWCTNLQQIQQKCEHLKQIQKS